MSVSCILSQIDSEPSQNVFRRMCFVPVKFYNHHYIHHHYDWTTNSHPPRQLNWNHGIRLNSVEFSEFEEFFAPAVARRGIPVELLRNSPNSSNAFTELILLMHCEPPHSFREWALLLVVTKRTLAHDPKEKRHKDIAPWWWDVPSWCDVLKSSFSSVQPAQPTIRKSFKAGSRPIWRAESIGTIQFVPVLLVVAPPVKTSSIFRFSEFGPLPFPPP